jgi:hypothetical protein
MGEGSDDAEQTRRYWMGVVHRDHALRGVSQGIAQTNHGAKFGVARMRAGDGFVYYSPKDVYPDGRSLREFTAPITPLLDVLELTRGIRNWGLQLQKGHLELSEHDFRVIGQQMGAGGLLAR